MTHRDNVWCLRLPCLKIALRSLMYINFLPHFSSLFSLFFTVMIMYCHYFFHYFNYRLYHYHYSSLLFHPRLKTHLFYISFPIRSPDLLSNFPRSSGSRLTQFCRYRGLLHMLEWPTLLLSSSAGQHSSSKKSVHRHINCMHLCWWAQNLTELKLLNLCRARQRRFGAPC